MYASAVNIPAKNTCTGITLMRRSRKSNRLSTAGEVAAVIPTLEILEQELRPCEACTNCTGRPLLHPGTLMR